MNKTEARIRHHEGARRFPYRCSSGKLSIGVGRNLEAVGLSDDEIDLLYRNDFRRAHDAAQTLPGYFNLNEVRRGVLVELCFQLGLDGVRKFRKFLAAYQEGDWQRAYDEMLDSVWAREQTPMRALRLAEIFLTGEYDD